MNKKAVILFSLITSVSSAAPPVTHQFTNGTTIEASQINSNYQELADRIEVLQNQVTQLQNIQPKQIIGFTSADANSFNPLGLTAQCQIEFANSRVCTSKEIIETTVIPTLPVNAFARVMPVNLQTQGLSAGVVSSNGGLMVNYGKCATFSTSTTSEDLLISNCSLTGVKVACCQ